MANSVHTKCFSLENSSSEVTCCCVDTKCPS